MRVVVAAEAANESGNHTGAEPLAVGLEANAGIEEAKEQNAVAAVAGSEAEGKVNAALAVEKATLVSEKATLVSEKATLVSEKTLLASEKAALEETEAQLRKQLSEVTTARDGLQKSLAAKESELQAAVAEGAGKVANLTVEMATAIANLTAEMATASQAAASQAELLRKEMQERLDAEKASMKEHEEREQASKTEMDTQMDSVRQQLSVTRDKQLAGESRGERLESDVQNLTMQLSDTRHKQFAGESRAERLETEVQNLTMSLNVTKTYLNIYKEIVVDPSLQLYIRAKATKIYYHPGVEGAANKTLTHVLPTLRAGHLRGQQWFNDTYNFTYSSLLAQMAHSGLDEYVGKERTRTWAPALSGFLVYGIVLVPLLITAWCLISVQRCVCRLRPCLIFCHLYFAVVTACATGFAVSTGTDPLRTFATHETSSFLFVQTCFGLMLLFYFAMVFAVFCTASGASVRCKRLVQLLCALLICGAYFVLVWTPAMTDRQPWLEEAVADALAAGLGPDQVPRTAPVKTCAPYALLSIIFVVLLCIERGVQKANGGVEPSKRDAGGDISFKMTDALPGDEVLAAIIGSGDLEGKHA